MLHPCTMLVTCIIHNQSDSDTFLGDSVDRTESTLLILMQLGDQRLAVDSRSKTGVLMRQSLTLQPKNFHLFYIRG